MSAACNVRNRSSNPLARVHFPDVGFGFGGEGILWEGAGEGERKGEAEEPLSARLEEGTKEEGFREKQ